MNKGFLVYCVVPGCMNEALSRYPNHWCEEHWSIYMTWPMVASNEPEPDWMKDTEWMNQKRKIKDS